MLRTLWLSFLLLMSLPAHAQEEPAAEEEASGRRIRSRAGSFHPWPLSRRTSQHWRCAS